MSDSILDLSTRVLPPKQFTVDGAAFVMKGIDHLTPADEASAVALFSRHTILALELEGTKDTKVGETKYNSLKACRLRILGLLTDMPADVAAALPIGEQVKLLEALQAELDGDEDPEEDGKVSPPDEG